ncbi:WS/DGAT domain-containing protein [Streptomyces anatolicus]|uniref:WS/DGAT domain-containing protein n=1 Tax=Streptomyces anatolicus TaxID=2675858 RepID=UPI001CA581A6|nr:WS/DGAT domain-containing protein [Streptomyces anatolicus]
MSAVEELLCGAGTVLDPPIGVAALFSGEPPRLDALRDRVAERWGGLPLLRRALLRPARPAWLRPHHWLPLDDFDVRTHVLGAEDEGEHVIAGTGEGERAFTDLLGRLVAEPVPYGLPPWRLRLVRAGRQGGTAQERFALVLTAHHALMDGRSLELLMSRLLDGRLLRGGTGTSTGTGRGAGTASDARPVRIPRPRRPEGSTPAGQPPDSGRLFDALRSGRALPLSAEPPRTRRDLAWAELDTDAVRAARRALPGLGATLNEVLLAAASGALRAVHGEPEGRAGASRPLHGVYSVDLRTPEQADTLGNIVSMVRLPLPVEITDPRERLAACRASSAAPGPAQGPDTTTRLVCAAARLGPWALRLLARRAYSPRWAPVSCTAVRWPRGPWALDGAPLERVIPLARVQIPGAVSLTLTSYANTFTLCVVSHTPEGQARLLADAFARELTSLAGAVGPQLSAPAR